MRHIALNNMEHVTGITEDPTGVLWVAGYCMTDDPAFPGPNDKFYEPYLARIPTDSDTGEVFSIEDLGSAPSYLTLPLSIVWTGIQDGCGGADLDGGGTVDFEDLAVLGQHWGRDDCAGSGNCGGADLEPAGNPDGDVDMADLAVLSQHWLDTGCSN